MFQSLIQLGISGIKSLITNARVGKQVLASGATVTTTQSGSGTNTNVLGGGSIGIPSWIMPVVIVAGVAIVVIGLIKMLFKK